jgi:alcohol dehydrogenase class IV
MIVHTPHQPIRFEFATAQRIVFGAGALREAGPLARSFGARALVVTGRSPERAAPLLDVLAAHQVEAVVFAVAGEPTTQAVAAGVESARRERCALLIAFGGGSAIDAAKAIAVLLTNGGELDDYLEVIGRGKPLTQLAAPCVAIPTTAGTGAEVTRNAVIAAPEHRLKASLRSLLMLPRAAVVDPELTYGLPPAVTASTGLDALTQLIEPYVSLRANPMTDALCLEGMRRVAQSLRRAFAHGQDAAAREDMALAALFSGLALANAGLGAVHGLAAPAGGMISVPHGAACAALLPHVMETNLKALRERHPQSSALPRYDQIARVLTGRPDAAAEEGVAWVRDLTRALAIPPLRAYGLAEDQLPILADKAAQASSMKANPVLLTREEMQGILRRAL